MIELWEIVLHYRKICHSVKNIFGLRAKSPYFIVFLEKMMLPRLCFPFTYLSTVSLFLLPSPLTGLTFRIPRRHLFFLLMSTSWTGLMADDMKGG